MKPSDAQKYILFLFSEFICIGGWEEFTPTIVIDYPIHSASSYNDYSGYNFYEVNINSGCQTKDLDISFLSVARW